VLFPDKDFNFPKMHQLVHLFDDIWNKGSVDYLSCVLGENFHQRLIEAYCASNGKEAVKQVLG
jgi:hypothetical protein